MYEFRRNSEDNYHHLVWLYRECFNIKTTISKLFSKYNTSKFGFSNVGYFAFKNDEIAAYYGVFPLLLKVKGHLINGAQSGDTMTAPLHQKKGLFVKLANATYELCDKIGIRIVFGFPNENSYPGFVKKLEWIFFGFMQKFTVKVFTLPLSEVAYRLTYFNYVYSLYVNWYLNKFKVENVASFDGFNYPESQDMVYKDENFFRYKMENSNCLFVRNKENLYFLKVDGHLMIGDVEYKSDFNVSMCIRDLKKMATILGCRKVVFYVSENHWLFNHLVKVVNPEKSLPIGFKYINHDIEGHNFKFSFVDFDTF